MLEKLKGNIDWFIRGKDGRVYLIQSPNGLIIGWFVCMIASKLVGAGSMKIVFSSLSLMLLAIWSYLEITRGQSYFRRTLGIVVMVLTIYSSANAGY